MLTFSDLRMLGLELFGCCLFRVPGDFVGSSSKFAPNFDSTTLPHFDGAVAGGAGTFSIKLSFSRGS